jgi:uncharacterized protein YjiK
VSSAVLLLLLFLSSPGSSLAVPGSASTPFWLVRVIDAPGSELSSSVGLAYSPEASAFLVPRAAGAGDVMLVSPFGDALGTVQIPAAVDPVNIAFDAAADRLLLFDATSSKLIDVKAQPDGRPDRSRVSRLDALPFGVQDPQGMTVDAETGTLFILDGRARRLVRIAPDALRGSGASAAPRASVTRLDLDDVGSDALRGVAFNPANRHLYVLAPSLQRLHELTEAGRLVDSHDLSHLPLSDPGGIAIAPSGDQTDDPAEMSLYVVDAGDPATSGAILEVSLTEAAVVAASAPLVAAFLVNTIDAFDFSPPSPDSAGLAYDPASDHLLISDSEVNEMSIFRDVNVWETSLDGDQIFETSSTTRFSGEPTGIAYDSFSGHYLISDDNAKQVFEIDLGRDQRLGTSDDVVTSLETRDFGSSDPEGVAYDSVRGRLFIADGANSEIYEIDPGSNGRIDGAPPGGDDQLVNQFDTESLGIRDPEGVEFDPESGDLYVVGRPSDRVAQITTAGVLVRMIDTSEADARKPAGITLAPGSIDPTTTVLYVAARGVDNGSDPSENDGRVYELAFGGGEGERQRIAGKQRSGAGLRRVRSNRGHALRSGVRAPQRADPEGAHPVHGRRGDVRGDLAHDRGSSHRRRFDLQLHVPERVVQGQNRGFGELVAACLDERGRRRDGTAQRRPRAHHSGDREPVRLVVRPGPGDPDQWHGRARGGVVRRQRRQGAPAAHRVRDRERRLRQRSPRPGRGVRRKRPRRRDLQQRRLQRWNAELLERVHAGLLRLHRLPGLRQRPEGVRRGV